MMERREAGRIMPQSGKRVAPALPAATVLLVRDAPSGLEVFMAERHRGSAFAQGALVFPGGRAEPADGDPAVHARCAGTEGLTRDQITLRVAAIRETFEESGVLLARPCGAPPQGKAAQRPRTARPKAAQRGKAERRQAPARSAQVSEGGPPQELIRAERLAALGARGEIHAGRLSLAALLEREDLELTCHLLVPFAHWITPEFMPKRYDTHFFVAAAPADQVAVHDGAELVDSLWIAPGEAEAQGRAGRRTIIFPTLMNLGKLARSRSVEAALEAARRDPVVAVLPHVERRGDSRVVCIPEEAGYALNEAPVDWLLPPGAARVGEPPRSA